MVTLNIQSTYDVTGTNDAQVYCLSTDTKPTGAPLKNGYKCIEVDTSTLYFYDEEYERWLPFGSGSPGPSGITVRPLTVTQNGNYPAPQGVAYSPVTVNVPSPPTYAGAYTVTPSDAVQTLSTQGKQMLDDVTVLEIPYAETANDYGTTVTIAS